MNPGLLVKLRPSGPWRIGPDSGARNRVDVIYHSDSLYGAVTSAMARLGRLDEWLAATARNSVPAVCFSSCFPFLDGVDFVVPPRTVWPPTSSGLVSSRVRWKSARFVPLPVIQSVLAGHRLTENWSVDGPSGCLVPDGRPGPFRTAVRTSAAVDRLTGASERHSMACLEFRPGAGLWTVAGFADDAARDQWQDAVKAAFRLLADSGFGGERSRGWGRSEAPEFTEGTLPDMIVGGAVEAPPRVPVDEPPEPTIENPAPIEAAVETSEVIEAPPGAPSPRASHWLLSLFTPAPSDSVDWARGNYTVLARGGRIDSPAGAGQLKKQIQMVAEGSVLVALAAPKGGAGDVAPDGFAHPVFRAGFALAIPLPESN